MAYRWKIFTNSVSVQSTVSNGELGEFDGWILQSEVGFGNVRLVKSNDGINRNIT